MFCSSCRSLLFGYMMFDVEPDPLLMMQNYSLGPLAVMLLLKKRSNVQSVNQAEVGRLLNPSCINLVETLPFSFAPSQQ